MAISTTIKLKFDGAAVKRGLAGLRSQFSSAIKNIGKIGLGAIGLGVGATAGLAAIGVKLNAIGEEGRAVDNRLRSITKQMGLFGDKSGDVSDRLSDVADTQARLTGIDDDVISNTEAKLMTFKELAKTANVVGGAFDRATMAAIDMAAAGFGEAEQNAVQLGKALNDPIKGITSLTKSGITFTAQEKKTIAAMVEMNQMGKAQEMVLKAIETQVGGTAAAVSTSSARMKVSFGQIIEEFSKNFSEGFNSLPGKFEGAFQQLKTKAGELGSILASAISDSINGNFEKFIAIGELIGTAVFSGYINLIKKELRYIGAGALAPFGLGGVALSAAQVMGKEDNRQLANSLRSAAGNIRTTGLVPGAPGFRYAQEGESSIYSDGNGNKVIEVLKSIDNKLSPQP